MGEALAGRRRWIWVAAAVVVLALIVYGVIHALTAGATEKPKAAATAAVDRGAVTTEVATTGTLQPAQTRSLSFAVAGTVESVAVRAGTTVSAGQTLAKVDDSDAAEAVDTAQDSLDQAETSLTEAKANASKATAATASCGTNVAAAYTSPTPSPSISASPSPSATKTTSPATTTSPTRTTRPATSPTATRGSGAGTGGKSGSTCSTAGTQQGSGSGSGSGSGQQGGGDAILSAEQRVTQANTTLEKAEEALEGATITAPIAGKIISVSGKVGNQVSAGSTFITLADVYDMQISADFPEADADRLAVKQKAVVTLADRAGKEFKATVVQVDPTGTSDGTMVRYGVVLSFDEAPQDLLVGQTAAVKVTTGSKADVLRVPSTAVHDVHGDSATVLKGGAQLKVGIGLRGDQYTEVTTGLAEGDTVVRSW